MQPKLNGKAGFLSTKILKSVRLKDFSVLDTLKLLNGMK